MVEITDRRIKLTQEEKDIICAEYAKGNISQRELARQYNVSQRLISFILFPEKLQENLKRRQERGGWRQYYDKEKRRLIMREYRKRKRELQKRAKTC